MRMGLLCFAVVLGLGLYQGWCEQAYRHMTDAALSEDARLAIDVRCRVDSARAARECRTTLKKLFLAGTLDPDKTIRAYCESVRMGQWGGLEPTPPDVCVQRYGSWKRS